MPDCLSPKFLHLASPGSARYSIGAQGIGMPFLLPSALTHATSQGLFLCLLLCVYCPGEERLFSSLVVASLFSTLFSSLQAPFLSIFLGFFLFLLPISPFRGKNPSLPFHTTFRNRQSLASVHLSSATLISACSLASPPDLSGTNLSKPGGQ